MLIRDATPDDSAAIAVLRLMWANERGDAVGHADTYASVLSAWIKSHAGSVIGKLAEREDGVIIAMGWLAVVDRLPMPNQHDRRSGDIQSVYVVPDQRSSGIGRNVINALVDEGRARGLNRIVLHSSTSGADFYRRIGWANSELLLELPL